MQCYILYTIQNTTDLTDGLRGSIDSNSTLNLAIMPQSLVHGLLIFLIIVQFCVVVLARYLRLLYTSM